MRNTSKGTSQTQARTSRNASGRKIAYVHIRTSVEEKRLIERAAMMEHKTVTDFVLESASKEANRILEEEATVRLPNEQWLALWEAIERPARKNARLETLAGRPSVFDGR